MRMVYMGPRQWARQRGRVMEGIYIPVDVSALEDDYIVRAYVPGVNAEDLQIEIEDDVVTLEGEFATSADEAERELLSELPSGHFHRRLRLGAELDPSQAKAEVKEGVLTLRVAKAERAKTKKIQVKAS